MFTHCVTHTHVNTFYVTMACDTRITSPGSIRLLAEMAYEMMRAVCFLTLMIGSAAGFLDDEESPLAEIHHERERRSVAGRYIRRYRYTICIYGYISCSVLSHQREILNIYEYILLRDKNAFRILYMHCHFIIFIGKSQAH